MEAGWEVTRICGSSRRNKDLQEVTLEKEGQVLLRFAAAYGFRNIQNVVLKLKRGKAPYHFVEVLACPGGETRRPGMGNLWPRGSHHFEVVRGPVLPCCSWSRGWEGRALEMQRRAGTGQGGVGPPTPNWL